MGNSLQVARSADISNLKTCLDLDHLILELAKGKLNRRILG